VVDGIGVEVGIQNEGRTFRSHSGEEGCRTNERIRWPRSSLAYSTRPHLNGASRTENFSGRSSIVASRAAFAELVRRHGRMVFGVCLRLLRHAQDAEDAFQATFLVLARKAGSISPPNAVGNWLYGVAHQTAVRSRAITMKRRARESLVSAVPELAAPESNWDDLAAILDDELARLPDHYRAVLVLCDVEGRTRADAATHIGCPEGSVSSRLSRARAMLARRLTQRGVTLSTGSLALFIGRNASAAVVPAALAKSTVEAAGLVAAGTTLAAGVFSGGLDTH